ncbi:glycosyl transferase, group 1 [Magnetococcus marinus MC-1]|uniref:Glycosyl transferase, group 1 n=1 Tax=Magnetococcus marinus (strain ATCC BAA-1437 / JCM 17883 / MC-1) TaxID=156889 RepID=A0L568_MAGMM|nr:TIGR03087 family PEP-CTERM/XrtA system glycosyltransferase [Magnetococcus marinus]ABK43111.1 glycosyl transferase, group 1 [Magnetococcus marinus MC-1]
MANILFLVHRIPYPPNKGDKVRAYHLLLELAARHRVAVGAFVDDPHDLQYAQELAALVEGPCHLVPLDPKRAKPASLRGLLKGEALSMPYYRSRRMRRWVEARFAAGLVDATVCYSSPMAQYVAHHNQPIIMDFVDVDSDKWRQYAQQQRGVMRWLYQREGTLLEWQEKAIADRVEAAYFVNAQEAEHFRSLHPARRGMVHHYDNGVDLEKFNPQLAFPNPYRGAPVLVFTGMMDYWPNIQAVVWFSKRVLPALRAHHGDLQLAIVGAKPTDEVKQLAALPGVMVTGRVADVRPYVAHAAFAIAPLLTARGTQNKVLEAMAMGKAVLATPQAMEGLASCAGVGRWVAAETATMVAHGLALLAEPELAAQSGAAGRRCVESHYHWPANIAPLLTTLEQLL